MNAGFLSSFPILHNSAASSIPCLSINSPYMSVLFLPFPLLPPIPPYVTAVSSFPCLSINSPYKTVLFLLVPFITSILPCCATPSLLVFLTIFPNIQTFCHQKFHLCILDRSPITSIYCVFFLYSFSSSTNSCLLYFILFIQFLIGNKQLQTTQMNGITNLMPPAPRWDHRHFLTVCKTVTLNVF